nr:putative tail tubular protein [uncultured Gammaproteobacteria bacterium]
MASEVDVCNDALTFIGATRITSLTDDLTEAGVMNQLYQRTVDAVLRAYPWKCAKMQASLAQSATAPTWDWDYAYRLPTDPLCLRVLDVKDADADDKWDRYGDFIYTDLTACSIVYIGRIDASVFDPILRDAIAAKLAADSAYPLVGSSSLVQMMYQTYQQKLEEAKEAGIAEGSSQVLVSNKLENIRK